MIILDFGTFKCKAVVFESSVAREFGRHLPYSIDLTNWGNELYGPIVVDLGSEKTVSEIPDGGIAYSQRGSYLCIFFGQTPAWPVDYIGQIAEEDIAKLTSNPLPGSVKIDAVK